MTSLERLTSARMSRKLLQALQSVSTASAYNVQDNEVARGNADDEPEEEPGDFHDQAPDLSIRTIDSSKDSSRIEQNPQSQASNASSIPSSLMAFAKFVRHNSISGSVSNSPVPPPPPETLKCSVYFLDDTQHLFELDRSAKGEELLDLVFRHLELIEREYFALQFSETVFHHHLQYSGARSGTLLSNSFGTTVSRYNRWLDPNKKIRKQLRFTKSPFKLYFRVKFYVTELGRLFEEYTRYHFYLQIRKDIFDGRLTGPESTIALLCSYVLQSELGDYSPDEHIDDYAAALCLIPNQTEEFDRKVISLHRMHSGQTPADAEYNYLEEAKKLEFYGVDLHQARDADSNDIEIGVSGAGLTVFRNLVKMNTFSWAKIVKISFKRRFFFVQLKHEGTETFENAVGFNLCSYRACKSLWKSCVEQHTFFRLHTPKPLTKKFFFFFSLGSKFRYSGKTEFQTIEENRRRLTRTSRIFIRNTSKRATNPVPIKNDIASQHLANLRMTSTPTVSGTSAGRSKVKFQLTNGHHSSKSGTSSSSSSTEDVESSSSLPMTSGPSVPMGVAARNKYSIDKSSTISLIVGKLSRTLPSSKKKLLNGNGSKQPVTNGVQQSVSYDNLGKQNSKVTSVKSGRSMLEKMWKGSMGGQRATDSNDGKATGTKSGRDCSLNDQISERRVDNHNLTQTTMLSIDDHKPGVDGCTPAECHTISGHHVKKESPLASGENLSSSLMDSPIFDLINELYQKGVSESSQATTNTVTTVPSKSTASALTNTTSSNLVSNPSPTVSSSNSSPVHLVTIRIKPDSEGKFGFNFKGGSDQNCDILISRVAPNTPADSAEPVRLNEGDQVLFINGKDVKGLKHEEVVDLIKSTNDTGSDAELCLVIRPLGIQVPLDDDDNPPNPGFIYSTQSGSSLESPLEVSMNLLADGLESEKILFAFEKLARRDERETISLARAVENEDKNRYSDIAPYDSTRVVLGECISGDYINASYVETRIESTNTVNRYIATQGPLKKTTSDFWQMCWEQECSVIVMVTPLVEDGRKKCYKYWPEIDQPMLVNGRLQLTQIKCVDEDAFLERTFHLHDPETGEEHEIKHLQYLAWPDQGIPDDDSDFLKLISRVRLLRTDSPDAHVVVHCSAGIGRTGVLILMETGICKIEANEPLYPLELVQMMRTQRAMLIQTTMQFYFVCTALYHVWRDKVVVPLSDTKTLNNNHNNYENSTQNNDNVGNIDDEHNEHEQHNENISIDQDNLNANNCEDNNNEDNEQEQKANDKLKDSEELNEEETSVVLESSNTELPTASLKSDVDLNVKENTLTQQSDN